MSVYFAQRDGLIKIGHSRSVAVRMSGLRAKLIGAIPGDRTTESEIHKRFAHLRAHGEWFRPDEELLTYISREAQKHKPDSDMIPTAIRFSESFIEQLDEIAEHLSRPGMIVTRTRALRMAIYLGVEKLEAEQSRKR